MKALLFSVVVTLVTTNRASLAQEPLDSASDAESRSPDTEADKLWLKFSQHNILKEVVEKVPPSMVHVQYGSNDSVDVGSVLRTKQISLQPTEVSWDADPSKSYILFLIDPDPPGRLAPFLGQINHWMVVNIKGSDVKTGDVKVPYNAPSPPPLTGYHRFIFLVYEQPYKQMRFQERDIRRYRFSVKNFAYRYNLGHPVAGNFFRTSFTLTN